MAVLQSEQSQRKRSSGAAFIPPTFSSRLLTTEGGEPVWLPASVQLPLFQTAASVLGLHAREYHATERRHGWRLASRLKANTLTLEEMAYGLQAGTSS
jgi:hypothetical protein